MSNQMMLYVGGGAVAGYFLGPSVGISDQMMGAAAGAVAGYLADMYMSQ